MTIELEGDSLTQQQRDRLLRAAGRCPVKRMMSGDMKDGIKTEVVAAGTRGS